MKEIIFLTGNINKVNEAQKIMGEDFLITNKKLDLPEIQSTDVSQVVIEKTKNAYKILKKPVFCEDTGVYIKNMNGFPGALIKFYFDKLDNKGISKFNGGSKAYAETVIGFHNGKEVITFKGVVNGRISKKPQGKGFGWDPIFIPGNTNKLSFAEMKQSEKNRISMRGKAFRKFKKYFI